MFLVMKDTSDCCIVVLELIFVCGARKREREILSKEFFVIKNIISRLHEKFRNSVLQFFFFFLENFFTSRWDEIKFVLETYRFFNKGNESISFGFERLWISHDSAISATRKQVHLLKKYEFFRYERVLGKLLLAVKVTRTFFSFFFFFFFPPLLPFEDSFIHKPTTFHPFEF